MAEKAKKGDTTGALVNSVRNQWMLFGPVNIPMAQDLEGGGMREFLGLRVAYGIDRHRADSEFHFFPCAVFDLQVGQVVSLILFICVKGSEVLCDGAVGRTH